MVSAHLTFFFFHLDVNLSVYPAFIRASNTSQRVRDQTASKISRIILMMKVWRLDKKKNQFLFCFFYLLAHWKGEIQTYNKRFGIKFVKNLQDVNSGGASLYFVPGESPSRCPSPPYHPNNTGSHFFLHDPDK